MMSPISALVYLFTLGQIDHFTACVLTADKKPVGKSILVNGTKPAAAGSRVYVAHFVFGVDSPIHRTNPIFDLRDSPSTVQHLVGEALAAQYNTNEWFLVSWIDARSHEPCTKPGHATEARCWLKKDIASSKAAAVHSSQYLKDAWTNLTNSAPLTDFRIIACGEMARKAWPNVTAQLSKDQHVLYSHAPYRRAKHPAAYAKHYSYPHRIEYAAADIIVSVFGTASPVCQGALQWLGGPHWANTLYDHFMHDAAEECDELEHLFHLGCSADEACKIMSDNFWNFSSSPSWSG